MKISTNKIKPSSLKHDEGRKQQDALCRRPSVVFCSGPALTQQSWACGGHSGQSTREALLSERIVTVSRGLTVHSEVCRCGTASSVLWGHHGGSVTQLRHENIIGHLITGGSQIKFGCAMCLNKTDNALFYLDFFVRPSFFFHWHSFCFKLREILVFTFLEILP